jgi:hypothetical protein
LGYPLYLIIDEYDNFTNTVLNQEGEAVYHALTHANGFYRDIFKLFKGMFARILMMGVSPVTMDDVTSGYNIASKKTRDMYDIRRVRVIVGVLLMLIAMALPAIAAMLIMGYKELVMTTLPAIVFVLIAATFTASHLWAKKKSK